MLKLRWNRVLAGTLAVLAGCAGPASMVGLPAEYEKTIDSLRRQKDREFAMGKNSPFAHRDGIFTGLKYFPADTAYRLTAGWVMADTTYVREIADSKGGIRAFRYSGELLFELSGREHRLPVWTDERMPEVLFIMFRDSTNGSETYGGGRYIEMQKPATGLPFILDFNLAFNPYCHYSEAYSCPVVPEDHRLRAYIRAGEKKYED